jgi:molybdate transport system ATP-binding protein
MAGTLNARFTRRFPGGPAIHADLAGVSGGTSVTVLFGPSGCGKTTVLRCLAGLDRPDEGFIRLDEETWFDAARGIERSPQQRGIGFVFQDYALFPHLTVEGNLGYGLRDLAAAERRRRVAALLAQFDLAGLGQRRPSQLSGGQQQRVALARALARSPRLLLLDEPLAALDATHREQLRGELRQLLLMCGTPALLVTHDRTEAMVLGDELVVMRDGRMCQAGPVLEVFNRPADAEVARIVGVETLHPGRVLGYHDGLADVQVGAAQLMAIALPGVARDVLACIRGEDVILERPGGMASSVRNRLTARVVALQPGSPLTRVELDAGFPLFALVTRPAIEELGLRPGEVVTALIKAPAVHLIARDA